MNQTFRKMYTPEEIKAIAGGGGGGKLYMHILDFSQNGGIDIIKNQIQDIKIYIICNSPTIFNSSNDYLQLLIKNQKVNDFIYLPCSYSSSFGSEQKSIINSFEIFTYNSDYQPNIQFRYSLKYFNIDSLSNGVQTTQSSLSSLYFQKDKSIVIPLG